MKSLLKTLTLALALCLSWAVNAQVLEGFEGGSIPAGWTTSGSITWQVADEASNYSSVSTPHGGSYMAVFENNGGSQDDGMLTSPMLDLTNETAPQLSFWYVNPVWSGDQNTLTVKYSSNGGATWTTAGTYSTSVTSWTQVTINIPATAATSTFMVQFVGTDSYGYDILLDDVSLPGTIFVPSCEAVTGLAMAESDWENYDFTFNWNGISNATGYNVIVSETAVTDFDNETPDYTTDTFYTATGLTADQTYHVYVQADCGGGDVSTWAHLELTTSQQYIMAAIGTATLNNPCGYTIYDDGGPNGEYSVNCNSTLILQPAAGQFVTLQGTAYVEGSYDHIYIYDGAGTSGTLLYSITSGTANYTFGPFNSDAGPMTIVFTSDASVTYSGFEIQVGCFTNTCPRPYSLTVEDIQTEEITVSWNPRGEESDWEVFCGADTIQVTDTFYTFTGLTPNTVYDLGVRAVCASDDMSAWVFNSARTSCVPIDTLPYTNGFEEYTTGASVDFIPCWDRMGYSQRPYVYSGNAHTGSKCLYFYGSNGANDYDAAIMHPIDPDMLTMSDLQVDFWARQWDNSYNCDIQVGVMTNPTDMSTFTLVSTAHPAGTTYEHFFVPFTDYEGEGTYICFKVVNHPGVNSYKYMAIDDITLDLAPSCTVPTNFTLDSLSSNLATLTWVSSTGSFELYYGPAGYVPDPDNDQPEYVSDTAYTLTELSSNTAYVAYLRTDCGGEYSDWAILSFRTECGDQYLPFTETFDAYTGSTGSNTMMPCWNVLHRNSSSYPYMTNGNTHSSGYCIMFSGWGTSGSIQTAAVVATPRIMAPANQIMLDFWKKSETTSGSSGSLLVGWTSTLDNLDSVITVGSFAANTTYQYHELDFSTVDAIADRADTGYVVFWPNGTSTAWYTWLDDVHIGQANPCPKPSTLTASNITSDEADITWSEVDGSNGYNFIISATPVTDFENYDGDIESLSTNSFHADQLSANTLYYIYVQNNCGDGYSNWKDASFCTACGPILHTELPYTYGFEDATAASSTGTINPCWRKYTDYSTAYPYPSSTAHSGTKSLYFYSTTTPYYSYAVMPLFEDSINTLMLKFWRYGGSSGYGRIKVGVMSNPAVKSTFETVAIFNDAIADANWHEEMVDFSSYTGTGRYIAFMADFTDSYTYTYIDDITVQAIPACAFARNLSVDGYTAGSARLSWQNFGEAAATEQASYTLTYVEAGNPSATPVVMNPTEPYAAITGLDSNTTYNVTLVSTCDGDTTAVLTTSFTTRGLPCALFDDEGYIDVTLGNGSQQEMYLPIYSNYNYGASQQLYLASEIGSAASEISSISFRYQSIIQTRGNWKIYLSSTSATSISNIDVNQSDFTLVYDGPSQMVIGDTGWVDYPFTTNFQYDGSSNLLVTIIDQTGSYQYANYAYCDPATGKAVERYTDTDPFTLANIGSNGSLSTLSYRAQTRFQGGSCAQQASCSNPMVWVDSVSSTSISVGIMPGYQENSWDVYYAPAGDTTWTLAGQATSGSYTVTGLTPATYYDVRVVTSCDNAEFPTTVRAVTECDLIPVTPTSPYTQDFEGEAPFCWSQDITAPVAGKEWTMDDNYMYNCHGNGDAEFWQQTTSGFTMVGKLITDAFDFTGMPTSARLRYYAVQLEYQTNGQPMHNVLYRTSPDGNWIHLDSNTMSLNSMTLFEYELPNSAQAPYYQIAFEAICPYGYGVALDDIVVDQYPSCQRPTDLACTIANGTASLSWNGTAASYTVTYGLFDDTGAVMQTITTTTTSASINMGNLQGGRYIVYVQANCGTELSDESNPVYFWVACSDPVSVPYSENFDSYTLDPASLDPPAAYFVAPLRYPRVQIPTCWTFPNQQTGDNLAPAAMPFLDPRYAHPTTCLWINARATGDHYSVLPLMDARIDTLVLYLDYMNSQESIEVGVMTDPTDITTFQGFETYGPGNGSIEHFFSADQLPSTTTTDYYIALRTYGSYYTFIDNVVVDYMPACMHLNDLSLVSSNATGVTLTWSDPNQAGSWQIATGTTEPDLATIQTVSTNPGTYSGLSCGSHNLWVRANCSASEQSRWIGPVTAMVVSDTVSYNMPTGDGVWDTATGCCFMVYDCGGPNGDYAISQNSYLVLMPGTDGAMMSVGGIITQMESNSYDYLKIYDGIGTVDTALLWEWTLGSTSSNVTVPACTSTTGPLTLYFHSDGSVCYSGFELLASCVGGNTCQSPAITRATNVDYQGATVNWTGSADDYEIAILTNGVWGDETAVQGFSYTFTGLLPETAYQFRVRAVCDEETTSNWAMGTFTTDSLPCMAPEALTASNVTGVSAVLSWTPVSNENVWEVRYAVQGDTFFVSSTSTSLELTGLRTNAIYTAWVRALCGDGTVESDWSESVEFTTVPCPAPSNVTVSNVTATGATISWTAPEGYNTFELLYGTEENASDMSIVQVNGTSYTLNSLQTDVRYYVTVRTKCAEGWISDLTPFINFRTVGIDDVDATAITLYPNPATDQVTIVGYEGEVLVVDMTGRTVLRTNDQTIDLSSLTSGAYFVRMGTTVKKLIVK